MSSPPSEMLASELLDELKKYKPADFDRTLQFQLFGLLGFGFSALFSLITLGLAWWLMFEVYFKCKSPLELVKAKLDVAQRALDLRSFADDLLGQMAADAHFDVKQNELEATFFLQSGYGPTTPAVGAGG